MQIGKLHEIYENDLHSEYSKSNANLSCGRDEIDLLNKASVHEYSR